jgi:hypothetical protein
VDSNAIHHAHRMLKCRDSVSRREGFH